MDVPSLFDLIVWHRFQEVKLLPKNHQRISRHNRLIRQAAFYTYYSVVLKNEQSLEKLRGVVPDDVLWRASKLYQQEESIIKCPGCRQNYGRMKHTKVQCSKCRIFLCYWCWAQHLESRNKDQITDTEKFRYHQIWWQFCSNSNPCFICKKYK